MTPKWHAGKRILSREKLQCPKASKGYVFTTSHLVCRFWGQLSFPCSSFLLSQIDTSPPNQDLTRVPMYCMHSICQYVNMSVDMSKYLTYMYQSRCLSSCPSRCPSMCHSICQQQKCPRYDMSEKMPVDMQAHMPIQMPDRRRVTTCHYKHQ